MSFERQPTDKWWREIPGARWFKTDLHVHTIDDIPGGRAKMPDGLSDAPNTPKVLSAYARHFLRGVIASGVQVVGLTPHSPRVRTDTNTSAVWKIVEEWNSANDDDGIPFREKIFAVFPGFEPNVNDGANGVHILFLFDPEIGRDRYLRLFDAIMDGRAPWAHAKLQLTRRKAEEVFDALEHGRSESQSTDDVPWGYIALAPHFQTPQGLFGTIRREVLERFPCDRLAGYELGDNKLAEDLEENKKPGSFLLPFMRRHRQAFFHGSDAYLIDDIGKRHIWMKLASPRIEALRQAFIASDSRLRTGFVRDQDGNLAEKPSPPDVTLTNRPWLKSVVVRGGASFFGGNDESNPRETRFDLSPDLTCIIGGSMTGKSTLLDGLREHVGAPPPTDASIREHTQARARLRFLAGSPEVGIDAPGSDPTANPDERWPARFFAQSELQRLAEAGSIEELLARLTAAEVSEIEERRSALRGLDRQLFAAAKGLAELDEALAEAEQDFARSKQAKKELDAFEGAGVGRLHTIARTRQIWETTHDEGVNLSATADKLLVSASSLEVPEIDDELNHLLTSSGNDPAELDPEGRWSRVLLHVQSVSTELKDWVKAVETTIANLKARESSVQKEAERALAARGLESSKLMEFQKLNKQAALLSSYESNLEETNRRVLVEEQSFAALQKQREDLVKEQRKTFDRVLEHVAQQFGHRIRARRLEGGDANSLDAFLAKLAQRGITRWWNDLGSDRKPSPKELLDGLANNSLGEIGMSPKVQQTFRESTTKSRRRELAAMRARDIYLLEMRMDDGSYRQLDELSGGQRVSILLSLLLETADSRPLVIDQPEDELDNHFLWSVILPALKRLKGKRQIVVATHNPNIVVNGDADMVIQLEATAQQGSVAQAGAIEEPAVRDAIVRTVDGGDEAFRLRRRKYGF
ncbi:MAG: AAA family ATPase [Gammaproteobacteria bacterium]|nr:AAA family ATPase [Gammaproteobacteria bacterium]MCY4339951.1 AAA family ATPase [Gammaproteobacteria bacterium]